MVEKISAHGAEARELATRLLQRARLADPIGGIWEAADVQWWWRQPRASDIVDQPFWLDDQGPIAGVLMTSWRDDRWQCDPVVVPSIPEIDPERVWGHARDLIHRHARGVIEVNLRDDDPSVTDMVADLGLSPGGQWTITWMDAQDRPAPRSPAEGFTIVDRDLRDGSPHPMGVRNGPAIVERLDECSLYEPRLDIAVETDDGHPAGYALYWFDPVTRVGYVEPMRVEDEFQRLGLATAMLTEGLERLASRGAERLKILHDSEAAAAVYQGVGFRTAATVTTYQAAL